MAWVQIQNHYKPFFFDTILKTHLKIKLHIMFHCLACNTRLNNEFLNIKIICFGLSLPSFVNKNLGSSPGWWAATVATYCPSRPGELP